MVGGAVVGAAVVGAADVGGAVVGVVVGAVDVVAVVSSLGVASLDDELPPHAAPNTTRDRTIGRRHIAETLPRVTVSE